jgi:hypothetical protein
LGGYRFLCRVFVSTGGKGMITHRWTVTAIDYAPTEIEEADSDLKERRAAALRHWERCFLDGTVDDQHAEFIAGILAKAREELE